MVGLRLNPAHPTSRQIDSILSATCSGVPMICGIATDSAQRDAASRNVTALPSALLAVAAISPLDAVADAVARIGDAALGFGSDLVALDVNPLWVRGNRVEALDALCVWQDGD